MKNYYGATLIVIVLALITLVFAGVAIGVKITEKAYDRYDVNRDGVVDVADCLAVQKRILG